MLICFLAVFSTTYSQQLTNTNDKDSKKTEFKVMPYVNYDRNLKLMFGALPMMLFHVDKEDDISPKSIAGLLGVYSTNESYFVLGFTQLYVLEDKWRASAYLITGNLNSQLYLEDVTSNNFYDFTTQATQIGVTVKRYIFGELYGGLGMTFAKYESISEEINEETNTYQNSINLSLLSDKRDDVYYPSEGHKITADWRFYPDGLGGNTGSARKLITTYNKYFAHKKNVIAVRFNGEFGLGDVKFEQQVVIGGKDIRGYSDAKFRGDGLMAVQGEYRWNLKKRFGLVGFAGLATIYGSPNPEFDWDLYPGIGTGVRYRVFDNSKFNIGLDVAVGKEDWSLSFRIGEAF